MRSLTLVSMSMAAALPLTLVAAAGDAVAAAPVRAAHRQSLPADCPDLLPPDDPTVYYCGRPELGPAVLPSTGAVAALLKGYHRLGGLQPTQFLDWYRNGDQWKYPGNRGFAELNGVLDMQRRTMLPGGLLDRFGADTGKYLANGGTPYAKRALPPDSLNGPGNGYHCYVVNRDFQVQAGHIAAGFAQPGFGTQEWLDPALKPADFADSETYNVANLVKHEYLADAAPERCAADRS
ncbi:TNT domain-containing protein [Kitasatospora sp. DSM 101779]|uniref:TNT domain-containing protein n=1 Tax=Kitasatospora sp. DSM 101779 TaxID=2853165 RepID=UPI0021D82647|nr:TNT domain-containing protein [Kitasatospora sp. DSM 101779]MCU7821154.1 TNT domain-containing protein [Kitasatospora sp. DSM 101779]